MSASMIFLNIIGSVALLLWGMGIVKRAVNKAYGASLRRLLLKCSRSNFKSAFAGVGVTLLLQSSTAVALIIASFTAKGLVTTPVALAMMLGADIGTTIVAQILSFDFSWLVPVLLILGLVISRTARSVRPKNTGSILLWLAVILLSLNMLLGLSEPLRQSEELQRLLTVLSDEPFLAILIIGFLTWLSHSSLAMILMVASFVSSGVIMMDLALLLVLGINIGGMFPALIASLPEGPGAKQVTLGNAIYKWAVVLALMPFLGLIDPLLDKIATDPAQKIVNFHTAISVLVFVIFIGTTKIMARLMAPVFPPDKQEEMRSKPRYISAEGMEHPSLALSNAAREALRMGDYLDTMLTKSLDVFHNNDEKVAKEIIALDDDVDNLYNAIKLHITTLSQRKLNDEEGQRATDILTFSTHLEHIGDIIDKSMMEMALKKIRHKRSFSDEGEQELRDIHEKVIDDLQVAFSVFMSGDVSLARKLVESKTRLRELENAAVENHLDRLRRGVSVSIDSSTLHIDILRDLSRIHGHICAVAYPVLDSVGELRKTRLKKPKS